MAQLQPAVERRELARDRAQQRRLARAVRPDEADALAAPRLQPLDAHDRLARIAADELLDADGRPRRRAARRLRTTPSSASTPVLCRSGAAAWLLEQRLETRLVLVHLGVLAVASIALDELALARDLLGERALVLARASVALLALQQRRPSSCRGRPSAGGRAAPRCGRRRRRGTRGRATPRAARRAARRASVSSHSIAARSRWLVGSSSISRSISATSSRASAARVCWPPDISVGGRSQSRAVEAQAGERCVDAQVERVAAAMVERLAQVGVLVRLDRLCAGRASSSASRRSMLLELRRRRRAPRRAASARR